MVLIKAYLGDDARRVTVDDNSTFIELRALLQKLFSITSASPSGVLPSGSSSSSSTTSEPTNFWIRYKDEEDELVSIATDSDLKEAIADAAKRADILRLYIHYTEEDAEKKEKETPAGKPPPVQVIPHHTLQHRNNLVLQSLAQPEFAVQVSKMVKQVVTAQNTAFTDILQQMVQSLAPQMETLLLPAVSAVIQQQQQAQPWFPPHPHPHLHPQTQPQPPNTYPPAGYPHLAATYPPSGSHVPVSPQPSAGLPEPLTPTSAEKDRKRDGPAAQGISAVRSILPSLFKVGTPSPSPPASGSEKDGRMSSSVPYPPHEERRKRSSSTISEADFSWVETDTASGTAPINIGAPPRRDRSSSNPVPMTPPSRTQSATDLSIVSPTSFATPSPLASAVSASVPPSQRARPSPALPPAGLSINEEQYQQLYRDWDPVLSQLRQMGFDDLRRNMDLIIAHKGSMVDVVEELLIRRS